MDGQERIEQAIGGCYDALLVPDTWPDALHGLARSLDAACCGFYPRDAGEARLRVPASHGYRDFLQEFVRDGWWRQDHRAKRGWPMAEAGRSILVEHDVASDEDRRKLPQYHDLYARHDVPWWGAAFFRHEGRLWAAPFLRSRSQGPFTPADGERLSRLIPHFERMLRLAGTLESAGARSTLDLLDRLACAAVLVDWQGRVIHCNARAERLLGSGLDLAHGRLTAADRDGDADLQRLIASAVGGSRPGAFAGADTVVIRRPAQRPLLVDALPAPENLADTFLSMRVMLLIADLDERPIPSETRLGIVFGLIRSEARLAALVGSGLSPREAAEKLGITEETARTTLKRVFEKAGVSRQSELAALVSKVSPRQ